VPKNRWKDCSLVRKAPIAFIKVVLYTRRAGKRGTRENCWSEYADTLEWTLPSPPPEHTFETLPKRSDWDKGHAR